MGTWDAACPLFSVQPRQGWNNLNSHPCDVRRYASGYDIDTRPANSRIAELPSSTSRRAADILLSRDFAKCLFFFVTTYISLSSIPRVCSSDIAGTGYILLLVLHCNIFNIQEVQNTNCIHTIFNPLGFKKMDANELSLLAVHICKQQC